MTIPLLRDLAVQGRRVLIRADLNVPMHAGNVRNAARIDAALPTIRHCLDANAAGALGFASRPANARPGGRSILVGAGGRGACFEARLPSGLATGLATSRGGPGRAASRCWRTSVSSQVRPPTIRRWRSGLAALCDVFVMDAFGTAHRAHASTCGVIDLAPAACAGLLLEAELNALGQVLENPVRPLLAIVGGAKVSSKLALLETLATRADAIIVGGGIANTFLLAAGASVGQSLVERDLCQRRSASWRRSMCRFPLT